MLLADCIDDYLFDSRKLSPITYRWYTQKLRVFQQRCHDHGITDMSQVSTHDIRRFLDVLATVETPLGEQR